MNPSKSLKSIKSFSSSGTSEKEKNPQISIEYLYSIIQDLRTQVSDLQRALSEQQTSQNRLAAQVRLMTNQLDKLTFSPLMLPDEITIRIFSYLSGPDLGVIALVCRDWNRISNDSLLWQHLVERIYGPHIRPRTLQLPPNSPSSGALLYFAQNLASKKKRISQPGMVKHSFDTRGYIPRRTEEPIHVESTPNEANIPLLFPRSPPDGETILIPRSESNSTEFNRYTGSTSRSAINIRRISSLSNISQLDTSIHQRSASLVYPDKQRPEVFSRVPLDEKYNSSNATTSSNQELPFPITDITEQTHSPSSTSLRYLEGPSPTSPTTRHKYPFSSPPNPSKTHRIRGSNASNASASDIITTNNSNYLQTWKDRYLELYLLERNWRSMSFQGHTYSFHSEAVSAIASPLGTSSQATAVIRPSHQFTQNTIATAGMDGRIVIWDLSRHSPVHVLQGHRGQINCLQASDSLLVSGGGFGDPSVRVWDRFSGTQLFNIQDHTGFVRCLQFDSDILVSGSVDKTVRSYSIRTGEPICIYGGHTKGIFSLAFDDTMIVSGSHDKTIRIYPRQIENLYNPSLPIPSQAVLHGHTSTVLNLAMTRSIPDSANLNHLTPKSHRIHTKSVSLASPFNPFLVSASRDCTLRLWDKSHATSVSVLKGHTAAVHLVEIRGTSIVLSASLDGTMRLWDIRAGNCTSSLSPVTVFSGHRGPINCMTAGDLRIITGGEDSTIRVWEQRMGPSIISSSSSKRFNSDSSLVLAYGLQSHLKNMESAPSEIHKNGTTYKLGSAITSMDLLSAKQRLVVGTRSGDISWFDFAYNVPHIHSGSSFFSNDLE